MRIYVPLLSCENIGGIEMDINCVDIYYSLNVDTDLDIVNGFGNIKAFLNEDFDEETSIGTISFNFYNVYELGGNLNLLESADGVSGDEEYMVSTLLQSGFEFADGGKLVTLNLIKIEDEYHTQELEGLILEKFLHFCSYMMFDYMLVIACKPMGEKGSAGKVIEFPQLKLYKEFSFEVVSGSASHAPVMLKNLNLID
jgi:hypothetical protein